MSSKPNSRIAKGSEVVPAASKTRPSSPPTEEQIRLRAFEKYCARSKSPGNAAGDWLEAERELLEVSSGKGRRLLPTVESA